MLLCAISLNGKYSILEDQNLSLKTLVSMKTILMSLKALSMKTVQSTDQFIVDL